MVKKIEIRVEIDEYDSIGELTDLDARLLEAAGKAADTAYAPYSHFNVGAAALLDNGEIIVGNNQENVAYPSGLCAERVVMFSVGAHHPDVPVKAIAITAKSEEFGIDEPLAPCGACRQVMVETEKKHGQNIRIILRGQKGKIHVVNSVSDILPFSFSSDKLKGK
ncbi:MAG TPA: cytidine deaminase [Flavobacteriales bacterium]|nr:cytidine deaminase [Flavobacteriales bacterium]HIO67596.1 cytidine deaminase [Flavobacteriales bacterium]